MATIEITVTGGTRGAKLSWDAKSKALKKSDDGYSATFETGDGSHVYVISVLGGPGEKWSATVEGGDDTNEHAGHMSPGGVDTTGDTLYEVS